MRSRSGRYPSTELSNEMNQAFQASTYGRVMSSMRGPVEPMSNGGPRADVAAGRAAGRAP